MQAMANRVCVVTGASTGLGYAAALGLARLDATVVMVSRHRERGERALAEVRAASGRDDVELYLADLSLPRSVADFAAALGRTHDRLHVLVNNAGLYFGERQTTADGLEATFALNHLGYVATTHHLLPLLQAGAPARVVNVSSYGHLFGRLDFDDLQYERRRYSGLGAYCASKLANVLFTYELARRLEPSGVTANCLSPGAVATRFAGEAHDWFGALVRLGRFAYASPERAARAHLHLASAPELATVTGRYFGGTKPRRTSAASHDRAAQERLWSLSAELLGL